MRYIRNRCKEGFVFLVSFLFVLSFLRGDINVVCLLTAAQSTAEIYSYSTVLYTTSTYIRTAVLLLGTINRYEYLPGTSLVPGTWWYRTLVR